MFDQTILVYLPMILFLGIITTYEDIKFGKIRNKWVFLAISYAIVANCIMYIVLVSTSESAVRGGYLLEMSVMVVLSLLLGFIMWNIGLWTAGDAKLFTAFASLIPLSTYKLGHLPYFDSANILINTFVPFFIFYSVVLLLKTTWEQKFFYLKKSLRIRTLISLFIFIFALIWPIQVFFNLVKVPGNFFFTIFILFIIMVILEKIFRVKITVIAGVLAVLRLIFDSTVFTKDAMMMLFLIFISFIFLRFFILSMGYDLLTRKVDINMLKKGMVPAERIFFEDNQYHKENILHFSLFEYLEETRRKRKLLFEPTAEGLKKKDIIEIKKNLKNFQFEHLKVYQTLAFAPYMFAGILLTILAQGNVFVIIITVIKNLF